MRSSPSMRVAFLVTAILAFDGWGLAGDYQGGYAATYTSTRR